MGRSNDTNDYNIIDTIIPMLKYCKKNKQNKTYIQKGNRYSLLKNHISKYVRKVIVKKMVGRITIYKSLTAMIIISIIIITFMHTKPGCTKYHKDKKASFIVVLFNLFIHKFPAMYNFDSIFKYKKGKHSGHRIFHEIIKRS